MFQRIDTDARTTVTDSCPGQLGRNGDGELAEGEEMQYVCSLMKV